MSEEKRRHALHHTKLGLTAPTPGVQGKRSVLKWDFWANNPRIVVRTNDPADQNKDYGMISAAMDLPTAYSILELITMSINSEKEVKYKVENYTAKYNKDRVGPMETQHVSDIWVGKDKEGCIFVSVISKKNDMSVIKFEFGMPDSRFHKVIHGDGTAFSKAELSKLFAQGHCEMMRNLLGNIAVSEYIENPPYKANQNYNRGDSSGYNKNTYQAKQAEKTEQEVVEDFTEDMPF